MVKEIPILQEPWAKLALILAKVVPKQPEGSSQGKQSKGGTGEEGARRARERSKARRGLDRM